MSDNYTIDVKPVKTSLLTPIRSDLFNDKPRNSTVQPVGLQRAMENRSSGRFGSLVGNTHGDNTDFEPTDGGGNILNVKDGVCYINGVRCVLGDTPSPIVNLINDNTYCVVYVTLPPEYLTSDEDPPFILTSDNFSYTYNVSGFTDPTYSVNNMIIANVIVGVGTISSIADRRPSLKRLIEYTIELPIGTILFYDGDGIGDVELRSEFVGGASGDTIYMPGWYVCNGVGGLTPNLLEKFIKCDTTVGLTGTGVNEVTLDYTHNPSHTHTYSYFNASAFAGPGNSYGYTGISSPNTTMYPTTTQPHLN